MKKNIFLFLTILMIAYLSYSNLEYQSDIKQIKVALESKITELDSLELTMNKKETQLLELKKLSEIWIARAHAIGYDKSNN